MKIKIFYSLCFILLVSVNCHAERVSSELKDTVMNLTIHNGIEILLFKNNKYIVSSANIAIKGNTASDQLNAMKIAQQLSEAKMSRFINGEDVYIKETLSSSRMSQTRHDKSKIIRDNEIYQAFIKSKSRGALNGFKSVRWRLDNVYYVATLLQFTQN